MDRNDASIFTLTEAAGSGALTDVTLNVESSGNTITTVSEVTFPAASCIGASASNAFNDSGDGATAPTAACNDTGSIQRPSADFSGSAVNTVEIPTYGLPDDWTGSIDLTLRYASVAASPTGNVEWDISGVCRAAAETWDGSFSSVSTITDAVAAQNVLNNATLTLTTSDVLTGCAAGEDFTLRISRDGTNDTNNDLAKLLWVKLKVRRAQ